MNSIVKPEGFVGLDYHDRQVQVCVVDLQGRRRLDRPVANDWQAVRQAAEGVCQVRGAAIEACTGAADLAEELVSRAGWSVDMAHPGYVHRMRHNPDKTDWADSHLLADLERVGYLPKVWLAPSYIRRLRMLVRFRQNLVTQRTRLKQQLQAVLRNQRLRCLQYRAWTKAWLAWLAGLSLDAASRWVIQNLLAELEHLAKQLREAHKQLEAYTQADPGVDRLLTMPGIGPVTAWALRAEIGPFERFRTGKQLARFCGTSPRNASSGQRQADSGLIRAGSPLLRPLLMELAHRLMRQQPRWQAFSQRLLGRGKKPNEVVAAVANRYMRWLYHQMLGPTGEPAGAGRPARRRPGRSDELASGPFSSPGRSERGDGPAEATEA